MARTGQEEEGCWQRIDLQCLDSAAPDAFHVTGD